MLCSLASLDSHDFPLLGIFLFYADPKHETEAGEPPLLRAAQLIRKGIPQIHGILLTKNNENKYIVHNGCITVKENKFLFTGLDLERSVNLYLDFYGESILVQNKMLLRLAKELNLYPSLGLVLKRSNNETVVEWKRLKIGKFAERERGGEFIDEWVAGLCQLYAQPTYALLSWLGGTRDEVASILSMRYEKNERSILSATEPMITVNQKFLAWFPDAKPICLADWFKHIGGLELDPKHVQFLNQHGPFAAGFYLVGLQGTITSPRMVFCDSVTSDWEVICSSERDNIICEEGTRTTSEEQKAVQVLFAGWNIYLAAEEQKNSSIYGWSQKTGTLLYILPILPYALGPVRIGEELSISDWCKEMAKEPCAVLEGCVEQSAAGLAEQMGPVFQYFMKGNGE